VTARVLYVVHTLASTGTRDLVRHLAAGLDRGRFSPEVLALRAARPGPAPAGEDAGAERAGEALLRSEDVPARVLEIATQAPPWRRLAPLVALLRAERFDVVHAHSRPADLWATWAGRAAGTPVRVYSRQATYGGLSLGGRLRYAATARIASRVIAVSEAVREHLARREGVPRRRIELIHDGIDLAPLRRVAPAAVTRARLGLAHDAPLVGCVAGLYPRKGHAFLIAAAPFVLARAPGARFVLVGDGPERTALEARVRAQGLEHAFRFLGWRADYADVIAALDVFVLPSLWEGLNLSLLSAAALGRAVVATNLASNREVIEPGTSGLLPTPARTSLEARSLDPRPLGEAIGGLLVDASARRRLGDAARRRVEERFDARLMAARHAELYARLLAGAAGRGARAARSGPSGPVVQQAASPSPEGAP
jgi:glycosyltransferase involved in cell wall biosynthesis